MVYRRDATQILVTAPDGSDPRWLGSIGHVTSLAYDFTYPGGCNQLSCVLQIPPSQRTEALSPGRLVYAYRGASICWQGILDEPQPSASGWALGAHGNGTYGTQFCDIWSSWSNPDDHINQAIARGLRWRNTGIAGTPGLWLGDQADSGSQMISDFLASITVQGALGWQIGRRTGLLTIAPLPVTVSRLLIATSPVARTVAGDINSIFLRYQATADNTATGRAASYGLANAVNAADIALHGTTETYYDLSSSGVMSSAAAAANGAAVLSRFNRASFAGPFTVGPGQLLNAGGVPVDLGSEQAGTVCRLLCTDLAFGGEVTAAPVTFITGAYAYDDTSQTAQVTPMQSVDDSFTGLLAAIYPVTATAA